MSEISIEFSSTGKADKENFIFARMKFLYPYFLWSFMVLLLPILLHLFHLRRFKTLYFSSIQFLRQVDTNAKSTRKIQQLLILLLRLFAFIFIVLAFAQPYFPNQATSVLKDGVNCIYIDNSLSMQSMGVEGELLSQAKQTAQKLISQNSPSKKYIILSNHFSAEEQAIVSKADALDYIDKLGFSNESRKMSDVVALQQNLLKENKKKGSFFWISDGQKTAWDTKDIKSTTSNVYSIILQAQNQQNLSIDSVWMSTPILKPNQKMELNIKASTYGESTQKKALIEVKIDNNKQTQTIEFSSNDKAVLKLNFITPNTGTHTIELKINDENAISFDDQFYATFEVKSHQKISIINGDKATSNAALVYQLDSFYQVSTQSKKHLNLSTLKQPQLILLNQVKAIEYGLSQYLINYAKQGGSLVLIPAYDCDAKSWNVFLRKLQLPVLQATNDTTQYIHTIHQKSTFFDGVFDEKVRQLLFPIKSKTDLKTYFNARLNPLLSYSNGLPFLCKSTIENNSIYLFNSGLGKTNNSFMQSDLFSTLFLRFAEQANNNNPLYITIGKYRKYAVDWSGRNNQPIEINLKNSRFIPQQTHAKNITTLIFNGAKNEQLLKQGIFSTEVNGKKLSSIAFNHSREESNTSYYTAEEIKTALATQGFKNANAKQIEQIDEVATIDFNNSNNIWRIMLILGIIFLFMEMILLKVFKL